MTAEPRLHVILPAHNRAEVTRRCAACLKAQAWPFRLILVDDGSTDGTAGAVLDLIPGATVIRGRGKWWWAGSLQQGLNLLRREDIPGHDIVLLLNDDTEFEPDFLERAVSFLETHPDTLLMARAHDRESGELVDAGTRVDWPRFLFTPVEPGQAPDCLATRGLFLRWADARRIGGFHPRLMPHYGSDYEYTLRAKRRGLALATSPEVVLRMDQGATGLRDLGGKTGWAFALALFSKRSPHNPFARSMLLILACPWRYKFWHLLRVWAGVAKGLLLHGLLRKRPGNNGDDGNDKATGSAA